MNPDERIQQLEERVKMLTDFVNTLLDWKQAREIQQLSFPVDDNSKKALGAPFFTGSGAAALTDSINLTGNAQTIAVPKAYADTILLDIEGRTYEVPIL